MQAVTLIDLIDEIAPEDGMVDIYELESSFARGTTKIARPPEEEVDAIVETVVTSEPTRRMSAVEWDAVLGAVAAESNSRTTTRMTAIQLTELAALITPVEVSVADEPTPEPSTVVALADLSSAPSIRHGLNRWLVAGWVAVAGAIAAVLVGAS